MDYQCPIQLKKGGQCVRIVRGLYGLYCGTHKHLQFHKKIIETESNIKAQVIETQIAFIQQKQDINEYKEEIKEPLQVQDQVINVLRDMVDSSSLERRSIKWIDYGQIRENRIQKYFNHCQSQRQKKLKQCRSRLTTIIN